MSTSDDNDDDSMDSDYGEPASRESRQKWLVIHSVVNFHEDSVHSFHTLFSLYI